MSFAKNLIQARKNMNLSSKEMAKKLGVTPAAYSNYEAGFREPKYDTLRKIAYILNVSIDKLLNVDPSPRDEYYFGIGLKIMESRGFVRAINPFDFYNYSKFDLYFIKGSYEQNHLPKTNEFQDIVAFKKSYFIELMESADKAIPDVDFRSAQVILLMNYISEFLACDGTYSEWLDDLNNVISLTQPLHPDIYLNNNILADKIIATANAKGFISRLDADMIIKTKANLRTLYDS